MKKPNLEEENVVLPTDFKQKCDIIISELEKTVFDIKEDDLYDYDSKGNIKKRKMNKGDVKPVCTSTKVDCKLNELFFLFMPIDEPEKLEPKDFITAFREFMRLMTRINDFVIMSANKQLFCGFVGITVENYNSMIMQPFFCSTFKRIDDRLVGNSLISAESGLLSDKAVIEKMQSKDIGFSMKKAEENVVIINNNRIDRQLIADKLAKYQAQIGKGD